MRRPDKHLLEAMRKLNTTPNDEPLIVCDGPEARILGLVPYTPRAAVMKHGSAPIERLADRASPTGDTIHCDECDGQVPWTQAVHRPFGIYCADPACESTGRRAHFPEPEND